MNINKNEKLSELNLVFLVCEEKKNEKCIQSNQIERIINNS